jgi:phosphohistidine phosphatase
VKTVFLVRHARAARWSGQASDFHRSLAAAGQEDARRMAERIKESGVSPSLLISSPARRALETAQIFAAVLNYPPGKIMLKESVYDNCGPESMINIISETDDHHGSIMLFGHNPTLSELAMMLAKDYRGEMPKGAVVGIEFKTGRWADIGKAEGYVSHLDYPRRATKPSDVKAGARIEKEKVEDPYPDDDNH